MLDSWQDMFLETSGVPGGADTKHLTTPTRENWEASSHFFYQPLLYKA